ncbi:MAG TPA: type 4a pilus biogenesis protein PilO [Gaiellaceae bacterium]|jgi:Tfp pilus assembly protein PilO|nr:type 4a pilus biogenesis protein PilO [Gaiellaceae bacterium]
MTARVTEITPVKLVLILAVTFLLLAGATWVTLVMPKQSKEASLQTTIEHTQSQLATIDHNAPAVQKHEISQTLLLARALPTDPGVPQIVLQLSRIATEEHVSFDSIAPQTPVSYSGYQAIPMTILLTGDYLDIESFLAQLRNQVGETSTGVTATGRLYDVLSVGLQATTPAPKLSATLVIDAFSYTGITAAAPGAATTTPAP